MELSKSRIYSIDLLRGLVMIIMTLDHTRDFFHFDAFLHDPLDVNTTSPWLFFTRWITHFCAPVFVFLSGTSIFLQGLRKSKIELRSFLIKRGFWLICTELFIINFSWTFDITMRTYVLQVIWAIGISMVCMSAIIRLPFKTIVISGLIIVFGHNVFDYVESTHHGFWWDLLRNGNFATYPFHEGHSLIIIYPFLPWLGLMMLGYCFGTFFTVQSNPAYRKRVFIKTGIALILFFILLRYANGYGNPYHWTVQNSWLFTKMSFLNVHKYPPSLLFLCMTIGPALLFLAFTEKSQNRLSNIISIYGRVPFFYYVLHFFLLHLIASMLWVTRGHSLTESTPDIFGIPFRYILAGEGYSLKTVYLVWILVVMALYPLCHGFNEYRKRKKYWWLSYL